MEKKNTNEEIKVKTVIFVPQTANSQLAKMLREEEATLEKMTGYKVKYVEKTGTSIGNLLCRSDHWGWKTVWKKGVLAMLHQRSNWKEHEPKLYQEEHCVQDLVPGLSG